MNTYVLFAKYLILDPREAENFLTLKISGKHLLLSENFLDEHFIRDDISQKISNVKLTSTTLIKLTI